MIDFVNTGTIYNGQWWTPTILRNWKLIQEARAYGNNAFLATNSMLTLNYFVKGALGGAKNEIYDLKNDMTKYLYTHYPCDVKLLKQTLKCHSCDGSGIYIKRYYDDVCEEDCWHCGGTGIYNTVTIVAFTFDIDGIPVSWHQPKGLVDFDVFIPATVGIYEGEKPARYTRNGNDENFLLDYLTVWEFLWREGVLARRIGLSSALLPI